MLSIFLCVCRPFKVVFYGPFTMERCFDFLTSKITFIAFIFVFFMMIKPFRQYPSVNIYKQQNAFRTLRTKWFTGVITEVYGKWSEVKVKDHKLNRVEKPLRIILVKYKYICSIWDEISLKNKVFSQLAQTFPSFIPWIFMNWSVVNFSLDSSGLIVLAGNLRFGCYFSYGQLHIYMVSVRRITMYQLLVALDYGHLCMQ